jgi:Cu(I)/Ag(I) efflux system membrane fusion protein
MKNVIYVSLVVVAVAGAFLLGRRLQPKTEPPPSADASQVLYYVDPMHPSYKSDKPGKAPDCGMELVAVYAKAVASSNEGESSGTVRIDAAQQRMIGLKTAAVERSSGTETMRVAGKVAVDDSRTARINAGVDGWLRQTTDATVGTYVRKDQTLASFYSPEFIALEQGYLVATERMGSTSKQLAAPGTQSTSARLRNYGMGETQIAEIASTRQMPENVNIVSPVDGFITVRNVAAGQRFDKGTELYRLADLSHVWILAELVESEAEYLRPGMSVKVNLPGGTRELQAHVSNVLPQFDPVSRTMNVRLEANNPGYLLRPDMFVDLEIKIKSAVGLEVPIDALLDTGTEQRVYVEQADGSFEARAVKTGARVGGRVEILNGLDAGERVVVAGNFLLDSETRLRSAGTKRREDKGALGTSPGDQGLLHRASATSASPSPIHSGGQP